MGACRGNGTSSKIGAADKVWREVQQPLLQKVGWVVGKPVLVAGRCSAD